MCQMCEREMQSARGHLSDLITEYLGVRKIASEEGLDCTDNQHMAALAGKLNTSVKEHYGVLNGQIAAAAIHQIATGVVDVSLELDGEQFTLAVITANEKLKENGLQTISTDAAHELLCAVAALQQP